MSFRENDETKEKAISSPEEVLEKPQHDFPDGGLRAWIVVFGCFMGACSTFGLINSWGVFQAYYETTILTDQNPSTIAWIGSVQYSLVFFPALISGRLFDLGHFRVPFGFWSAVFVVTIFLTAQCKQYWHFLLCQGFAQGLAAGMTFTPVMAVVGHWFLKKRGQALGIGALGSAVGGTVFPILTRSLIREIGFKWAVRTLGFIILVTMVLCNLTLRRRLPPKNVKGGLINPRAFKNPAYAVYCLAQLTAFLGIYTLLIYIDISATFVGVSPEFSFYLVSIANAAGAFGRVLGGYFADKIGIVNLTIPATTLLAILTYVWPYIDSKGGYIGLAVPYGFTTGVIIPAFMLPVYAMGEIEDIGRRTGMVLSIAALGALAGPPISGAINHSTGNYKLVGVYAGTICLVSVVLLLVTRYIVLKGKLWGKF
ncbi:MFS general substrate transporter [Flagelloscypha sp. PMI_526]|nr:MFS general substrate transporter [Flagelloscypha sp. PMI_526]